MVDAGGPSAGDVARAKALFFEALDLLDAARFAPAETRLRSALALVPDRVSALTNLAVALFRQNKLAEAIDVARRSVELDADNLEGWLIYASCLTEQGRPGESLTICERLIAADPRNAEAHLARGLALAQMKRSSDALAALDTVIALDPDLPEAWMARGRVFASDAKHDLAAAAFARALEIKPTLEEALGHHVHSRMHICDWNGIEQEWSKLLAALHGGARASQPFQLLSMPSTPADQLAAARLSVPPPADKPLWAGETYRHDRIRVAYLSTDFREHPVGLLTGGLFEAHDRARFEVTGLSLGPDDGSARRARILRGFDRFIDVRSKSDREIAMLVRESEVDVLVDLNGHTSGSRTGVLALRPAPVQVNYLGYPGTLGAPYADYIIADRVVIPAGQSSNYSEQVVTLPDTYQANDGAREKPGAPPPRTAVGLPAAGFVFCCFNNSFKILPDVFAVWMDLLRRVDGSVLWLLKGNTAVSENLRREAAARGVSPDRLVFAPRAPLGEHIARHQLADLFLDTSPYNAHTTASDALWTGVPLVTLAGSTFASRVGASILSAAGLEELVTDSLPAYADLAFRLATDAGRLAALKRRLNDPAGLPLFDTARFARHIEAAYTTMVERSRRGEAPASFAVAPIR